MFRQGASRSPELPRELTPDMRADAEHAGKFLRLFGGLWAVIGAVVGAVLTASLGSVTPLAACGFFAVAGTVLYVLGVQLRRTRLELFRTGQEHDGRVESVHHDRNVRMNGRHPYRVRYRFVVDGVEREGTDTFWTDQPPAVKPGERVAILSGPGGTALFTRVNLEPSKVRVAGEGENVRVATATAEADEELATGDASSSARLRRS